MDHKIKNQFTKECEGLMNPLNNPIVRKNYLTKEYRGLMNPTSFDLSKEKSKNKDNLIFSPYFSIIKFHQ